MADSTWTRRRFIGTGLGSGVALALGACGLNRGASVDRTQEKGAWGGQLMDPPFEKPDRVFIDHDGKPFDMRADTDGRLTMLFFGYTHCPDVCPVYLAQMASALDAIGSGPGSRPLVLLIGVDIARDTPEVLKQYMARFGGENFIGLTADAETIAAAHDDLKFPQTIIHPPDENGDYAVDHPAYAVAFSPDNLGHRLYRTGDVRQQDWVKDLPRLDQGQFA